MELILLAGLFWGILMGFAAKQKNRSPWGWGIAGALSWPIALLILALLPSVCPKCGEHLTKKQGKEKECPACGSFATTSRAPDIWLRIKQGDFAAAQKYKSASFDVRAAIVFTVFWIFCVGAYVYLFDPSWYKPRWHPYATMDGRSVIDYSGYYHMLKVMVFPPVVVLVGLFLYKKLLAPTTAKKPKDDT